MKIYLDSEDSYYSIKHEPEPKQKRKTNKNDEKIGIISLILIIAFAVYIISHVFSYAYGQSDLEYSGFSVDMSIRYPEDWVYSEYGGGIFSNDDSTTVFVPSSEVSFLSNLTESNPDVYVQIGKQRDLPYKNMPLDLYFDYAKKFRISQGFNITNTGKMNLTDGRPAYEIDAITNNSTERMIVALMNKNPESYFFVYSATPDKFNTYLPVAQQMFKTLSFK